jgi:hypothetical protein
MKTFSGDACDSCSKPCKAEDVPMRYLNAKGVLKKKIICFTCIKYKRRPKKLEAKDMDTVSDEIINLLAYRGADFPESCVALSLSVAKNMLKHGVKPKGSGSIRAFCKIQEESLKRFFVENNLMGEDE